MKRHRRRWTAGSVMVILGLGIALTGCGDGSADAAFGGPEANAITLDSMAQRGTLERPAVLFPHDSHVDSLGEVDSCVACHDLTERPLSFDYVQAEGLGDRAVRNLWHQQCLECHQTMVDDGQASGPLTCGGCHIRNYPSVPPPQSTAFYDTVHEIHEYLDEGCGLCHHAYDPDADELYYTEGVEEACWQCHTQSGDDGVPALKDASHQTCIPCHLDAGDPVAMPVGCAGCHGTGE